MNEGGRNRGETADKRRESGQEQGSILRKEWRQKRGSRRVFTEIETILKDS